MVVAVPGGCTWASTGVVLGLLCELTRLRLKFDCGGWRLAVGSAASFTVGGIGCVVRVCWPSPLQVFSLAVLSV